MNMRRRFIYVVALSLLVVQLCRAEDCGIQAGYVMCADGSCCSAWGYCGNTTAYCGHGCQSNCHCTICEDGSSTTLAVSTLTGQASYYTQFIPSNCYEGDLNQFPHNGFFAAGGDGQPNIWNKGNNCGKWFKINCIGHGCTSNDTISVKIVDHCANGCAGGRAFDLSYTVFKAIADPVVGVITVEYSGPYDNA